MNNNEITEKRNQAIKNANGVYQNIVQNQTDLINKQSNDIDNYLVNSESAINQGINNNIGALQNAQETAQRQQAQNNQRYMANYENMANNLDESSRISALNATRNRMAVEDQSISDIMQEYNNQIAQAKITGQSIIAQQALDMLKTKMNLHAQGMQNINDALIGQNNNAQNLTKMYGDLDNSYSNANNAKLKLDENARQFNQRLAYNNEQLKVQKNLKEQQYQLDLRDAKNAYYKRYSGGGSGGSGGYSLSGGSGSAGGAQLSGNTNQGTSQGASVDVKGTYYSDRTPYGLSSAGSNAFKTLEKVEKKYGYVTGNYLVQTLNGSGLTEKDRTLIAMAYQPGKQNKTSKVATVLNKIRSKLQII